MLLFQQRQLPPDRVNFFVFLHFLLCYLNLWYYSFKSEWKANTHISQKSLVGQIVGTGGPFCKTGGSFGPPVIQLSS